MISTKRTIDAIAMIAHLSGGTVSESRLLAVLYRVERHCTLVRDRYFLDGPLQTSDIGPVHAQAYDLVDYSGDHGPFCIEDGLVIARDGLTENDLGELSRADWTAAREIVAQTRDLDDDALIAQSRSLPECGLADSHGGALSHYDILVAAGRSDARAIADHIEEMQSIGLALESMRA